MTFLILHTTHPTPHIALGTVTRRDETGGTTGLGERSEYGPTPQGERPGSVKKYGSVFGAAYTGSRWAEVHVAVGFRNF